MLNNTSLKEVWKKPQHDLAVVPIDKATNNRFYYSKIRFYATNLFKEFGVLGTLTKTYEIISDCNKNILTVMWRSFKHHIGYQK